jgi:HD-like signal output (HDOD) protein
MPDSVYQRLRKSAPLPSPGSVALEIVRVVQDSKTTVRDIALLVERDPASAARILKYVNSPYAGVGTSITSISHAVTMLGMQTVSLILLGFSLVDQARRGRCEAFEYNTFWSESLARAVVARELAQVGSGVDPDEAFVCGLLCQIGRLAFATALPREYARLLPLAPPHDNAALAERERAAFEISHCDLAAHMMTDWKLPRTLCEAVRLQQQPDRVPQEDATTLQVATVLFATEPAARLFITTDTPFKTEWSLLRRRLMPLKCAQHIGAIVEHSHASWKDMGAVFEIGTPTPQGLADHLAGASDAGAATSVHVND